MGVERGQTKERRFGNNKSTEEVCVLVVDMLLEQGHGHEGTVTTFALEGLVPRWVWADGVHRPFVLL